MSRAATCFWCCHRDPAFRGHTPWCPLPGDPSLVPPLSRASVENTQQVMLPLEALPFLRPLAVCAQALFTVRKSGLREEHGEIHQGGGSLAGSETQGEGQRQNRG